MMKGLHVIGCPTVISTYHDPSLRPERLEKLFAWAEAGKLKPYVSKVFDIMDVKEALRAKWQSQYVGSIALACTP
jgi:NADPH2:quinone reductase